MLPTLRYYGVDMIVPIKQIQQAFDNANRAVAASPIHSLRAHRTTWIETYGITPLLTNDGYVTWESLQFKSEQDYIMFLLKWS